MKMYFISVLSLNNDMRLLKTYFPLHVRWDIPDLQLAAPVKKKKVVNVKKFHKAINHISQSYLDLNGPDSYKPHSHL